MSVWIEGMGWVTPFGAGLEEVWRRVQAGERAEVRELKNPDGSKIYPYLALPPKVTAALERNPRLRRSSTISLATAAAGLAALEDAGVQISPEMAERTALVFAITDGGVVYSRKFYEQIVSGGAKGASPLLFPETVYNAPASHLAALLGLTGSTYTLVGDSTVGISALKFAEQLLRNNEAERVLVVGGEEIDWVLGEAYAGWRLARRRAESTGGMLLAEGAAAILVGLRGKVRLAKISDGVPYFSRAGAAEALRVALADLCGEEGDPPLVVCSANGTFIDGAEEKVLRAMWPGARQMKPKESLGDALSAGALMQAIVATMALQEGGLSSTVASVLGLNQHASGVLIRPA